MGIFKSRRGPSGLHRQKDTGSGQGLSKVAVIGVPFDLGAGKRGAAGGPAAIRRADLIPRLESLGLSVSDWGDVPIEKAAEKSGNPRMKNAPAVRQMCAALADKTCQALQEGAHPVVLGGDHSLAMGSAAGVARFCAKRKKSIGIVWVDAHGDFNTPETSPSGNLHGMPLAHLLGMGDRTLGHIAGFSPAVDPEHGCLVGARDLDANEKVNLRRSGLRVFTMADIDRMGMAAVAEQVVELAGRGTAGIHVSFDVDAADPSIAQGVGTPKRGGLTYRESHLLMEIIAESGRMLSLDMVEVNPLEDSHNETAELASELIQSALGKRIF